MSEMPGTVPPAEPEPQPDRRGGYCAYCFGWAEQGVPTDDGYVTHERHAEDYRRWQAAAAEGR